MKSLTQNYNEMDNMKKNKNNRKTEKEAKVSFIVPRSDKPFILFPVSKRAKNFVMRYNLRYVAPRGKKE